MGSCLHVQMRGRAPEGGFCSFFILFYFICLFILDRPIQVCKVQHRHQENKQRQWHFNRSKQPCKNNIVDSDILNIRFCASRIRTDTKNGSWYKKVIKKTLKTITCVRLQRQICMTSFLLFFPFVFSAGILPLLTETSVFQRVVISAVSTSSVVLVWPARVLSSLITIVLSHCGHWT